MEEFDFDKPIDRRGTGCIKWDALPAYYGREDLLPLWIADMDFATPDCIREAVRKRLEHPVLGYGFEHPDFRPAIVDWLKARHGWDVEGEAISFLPGIVRGIAYAVEYLLGPGEKLVVQPPVYPPFTHVPSELGHAVVDNPLRETATGYEMDLEGLEQLLDADPSCKAVLISNPHNPGGIVWPKETLARLAEICFARKVIVFSDEIHCDLPLFGHRHVPFATVSPEAASICVTFGAASKTFNMAGLSSAFAVVTDPELRKRFYTPLCAGEFCFAPLFAEEAAVAAFRHGEPWRQAVIRYIEGNVDYVCAYVAEHLPRLRVMKPQASFLVWLDCRGLGLTADELKRWCEDEAHLALNAGDSFGKSGAGFMRLNVGTRRAVLEEVMARLERASRRFN